MINYIELEFDHESRVLCATGLCPHPGWMRSKLQVPRARPAALFVISPAQVVPGISFRLTEPDGWPVRVDLAIGWLCIGDPRCAAEDDAIRFAADSIAVLRRGALVALWLHPRSLPALPE